MKKKKATHKSSPNRKTYSTDPTNQRKRILRKLRKRGPEGLTTIQAREQIDVFAPAPRIFELRHRQGYNIQTVWSLDINAQGNEHRVARYVLFPGKWIGRQLTN